MKKTKRGRDMKIRRDSEIETRKHGSKSLELPAHGKLYFSFWKEMEDVCKNGKI